MPKRVLLIGWDAADWKVIQPLLVKGEMPNLARLIAGGLHGNIATIYPVLSPMLWTSIATGKRAFKHGIHGFSEPLPDGSGVRPISITSRTTKAVWNILNQTGHRSIVVGWWPSHPAEPLDGVMVSNHFQNPVGEPGSMPALPAGTVHPASLSHALGELRVNPMELDGEFLRLFIPEYQRVDQEKDKRVHSLAKIIAETMSVHAVATELLGTEKWDFAAIYYSGIDHFAHGFMRYHPPQLPWVSDEDFALYQHVITNAYRYHDSMLGALLGFADEHTTVILMSDHGFHADHLRPGYIPVEPAGPAVEHRHYGILCMKGPGLRSNEQLFGASLLDICPTILTLFGLPPGRDMDGKVLLTAFKQAPAIEPVESWDRVGGNDGVHGKATQVDPVSSAQAFKQLMELGYVAPPAGTIQETIDECIRELKYNLARAWRDANCCGEAAGLAEELWNRWPKEHRFGILLAECLGDLRQAARRRTVIEELACRIERYQKEAKVELEQREKNKSVEGKTEIEPGMEVVTREQYEERQWRELALGRPLLVEWLRVSQALLENKTGEARRHLSGLMATDATHPELNQRIAGALAKLGDLEAARTLLDSVLQADPENAQAHSQMARIHVQSGKFEQAISAAAESLSLLYFQPDMHALLGRALMECGKFAEAEQELRVAVGQSPRNLFAHELLGRLYRGPLGRPDDAFGHEGRARSLRHELTQQAMGGKAADAAAEISDSPGPSISSGNSVDVPEPFGPEVDRREVITVVSGLPRSGTSMMMQLLSAGGREALSDSKRAADEDNPLGYFEFERALNLAKDSSWVSQARGKVVKVVAQLLPLLPKGEHYNVVFMERNLSEVIASQRAMLERKGKRGAELDEGQLVRTYTAQVERACSLVAGRSDTRMLAVNYAQLLADPAAGVNRLARFLGDALDCEAAASSIRPELQRQKA
jgi:predicted AlkP superfamily phosphohydrolase/phosphomutase/tetratricopeptide (TPR) repeat protein